MDGRGKKIYKNPFKNVQEKKEPSSKAEALVL
jgi:hypothetical protein